jgi:hypothetical protein
LFLEDFADATPQGLESLVFALALRKGSRVRGIWAAYHPHLRARREFCRASIFNRIEYLDATRSSFAGIAIPGAAF